MMKKLKTIILHPMLLVLIFILLVYFPTSISAPPEGVERQHIATVGLDSAENGQIELSVLTHVSSQSSSFKETYIVTSTIAPSIPEALHQISSITGRQTALTHTTSIVVSQPLATLGLHNYLDYFYRNNNVANDTFVVCTTGPAKDLLNFEKERINSAGYGLEEILVYNSENTYFSDSNLESFYKGYFSPTHTSMIAVATLEDNPDGEQTLGAGGGGSDGGSASSASGGSSGESGGSSSGPKRIKSISSLALLKRGRLVDILSPDAVLGLNLVTSSTHNIFFSINDFTDNLFTSARLDFRVVTNKVSFVASFENARPVLDITSLVSLSLEGVQAETAQKEYYFNNLKILSPQLKNAISQTLKTYVANFLTQTISARTDTFGVYTTFTNHTHQKFLDWFKGLDTPQDFLSKIEFRMTINPILST